MSGKRKKQTKEESAAAISGLNHYIRRLYSKGFFPKVDKNGAVYTTAVGASGRKAGANKEFYKGSNLLRHLEEHFPCGFIHHATAPEGRALKHIQRSTQLPFSFNPTKAGTVATKPWPYDRCCLAAKEFEVPRSAPMMFFMPEIFDRDILIQQEQFHYKYTDENKQPCIGLKTPCPYCKTNDFVTLEKSGYKAGYHRSIADYRTSIPVFAFEITCNNPTCSGANQSSDGAEKASAHTVLGYMPQVLELYPAGLRDRYKQWLFQVVGDGKTRATMYTENLAHEILRADVNFSQMAEDMVLAHERAKDNAILSYISFLKTQQAIRWPEFDTKAFDSVFAPPSRNVLNKIFFQSFEIVLPHLQRDLFNRTPGRRICWDGTFRYMSRTMSNPNSPGTNKCLLIVYDGHGRVLSWAFDEIENDECTQVLLWFIKKRCERIGIGHVEAVVAAHSDTCCQGLDDPTKHWITRIYPNVKRAPYKDLLHAQMKVNDASQPHHELGPTFNETISQALLIHDEASVKSLIPWYRKKVNDPKLPVDIAKAQMIKDKDAKTRIKNYTPHRDVVDMKLRAAYEMIAQADRNKMHEANLKDKGYLSFITPTRDVGGRKVLGTKDALFNLLTHVKKGCCSDPFEMDEVNVALDPNDKHTKYWRDRGTSQGESCHRLINLLVAVVGRQSTDLADAKLWIKISEYNLDKDEKLSKVENSGKQRTFYWFLKEALQKKSPWMNCFEGYKFPPELPDEYNEPIGKLYQLYKQEKQQEFSALLDSFVDDRPAPESPAAAAAASPPTFPVSVPPIADGERHPGRSTEQVGASQPRRRPALIGLCRPLTNYTAGVLRSPGAQHGGIRGKSHLLGIGGQK